MRCVHSKGAVVLKNREKRVALAQQVRSLTCESLIGRVTETVWRWITDETVTVTLRKRIGGHVRFGCWGVSR